MEEQETVAVQPSTETETICFQLHVRMPAVRRKGDVSAVDLHGAAEELISISKSIVDSDEFRAIQRHVQHMKAFIKARSVPSPLFRGGVYQIPFSRVEIVDSRIEEMTAEHKLLVDEFLDAYVGRHGHLISLVEQAKNRLGPQFDPADYPTEEQLRKGFGIHTMYHETTVPTKPKSVSGAIFKREADKLKATFARLDEEVSAILRSEMKDLVDGMVRALEPKSDGKKRAFRRAGVEKLLEFLNEAPHRNVTHDEQLNRILEQTKKLMDGVDVDFVREDAGYRQAVATSFGVVKKHLDTLVAERPRRLVEFGEDV